MQALNKTDIRVFKYPANFLPAQKLILIKEWRQSVFYIE